jgi:hypothetical protein
MTRVLEGTCTPPETAVTLLPTRGAIHGSAAAEPGEKSG